MLYYMLYAQLFLWLQRVIHRDPWYESHTKVIILYVGKYQISYIRIDLEKLIFFQLA